MKNHIIVGLGALAFTLGTGCGKSSDDKKESELGKSADEGAAGTAETSGTSDEGAAKPKVWAMLVVLEGLVASVPSNATLGPMGGIITDDGSCSLDVFEKSDASPSYENMLANVEKGNKGGPLKTMVKNEMTDADNWVLQWTTDSGKFGYAARRKIGDKSYDCINFKADSQEKHKCAVQICDSLRAE